MCAMCTAKMAIRLWTEKVEPKNNCVFALLDDDGVVMAAISSLPGYIVSLPEQRNPQETISWNAIVTCDHGFAHTLYQMTSSPTTESPPEDWGKEIVSRLTSLSCALSLTLAQPISRSFGRTLYHRTLGTQTTEPQSRYP
uniref:FGGY_N domain-containing protein n=1 Tax=Panagrellus redivivus TaxID=6233 RepID=A0A7E4V3B0_PANRE